MCLVYFVPALRTSQCFSLLQLACRLLYDVLPGLEGSIVFQQTEGIVSKLYHWAELAENPLKSYAIGLLAAAMEVQDIAIHWREQNAKLVCIWTSARRRRRCQSSSNSSLIFLAIAKASLGCPHKGSQYIQSKSLMSSL